LGDRRAGRRCCEELPDARELLEDLDDRTNRQHIEGEPSNEHAVH
jgi:hypothetical protein